jgi:hypothetical protein
MGDLQLASPILQRLYRDWDDRRRGRCLPARSDFDVLELKYILGNLNLLDVLGDPLRFRYRVHGTNNVRRLNLDMTGKTVDQYPNPTYVRRVHGSFTEVVETRAPKCDVGVEEVNDKYVSFEALILPLSDDGEGVHRIMVGINLL